MSDQTHTFLTRAQIFTYVFFAVFVFLLYQLVTMLAPFLSALLWAAILTLAFYPLYEKILSLTGGRAGLAAAIMTLAILLLVVGPTIFLLGMLTTQAVDLYQWGSSLLQSGKLAEAWSRITSPFLERIAALPFLAELDVKAILIKGLSDFSSGMASQIGGVLKNTVVLMVNLVIMLVSLFFFFRNGDSYLRSALEVLPFSGVQKRTLTEKLHDTFKAVISGVFVIALMQGIMTGIGFALFGVPFPVFWGVLAAVLALLPFGGAALVWIPGVAYLYLTGSTLHGIFLAVWGTLLVSLPDNFLKPMIIGKKANISSFFLFLGILGGLQVYGFLGILFGPIVVTLLTAFVEIYREEYTDQ